jgi:hypothetical protein
MDAARPTIRLLAFLVLLAPAAGAAPSVAPAASSDRIVAVGDVHGDLDAFRAILREAGILSEKGHWDGGRTTFVQLGDFTDRGPKVRGVMDLLGELEERAPASGGRVVVLLGNHEMLNLLGDLRYVASEDYAAFVDGSSERRRRDAYRAYAGTLRRRGRQPQTEDEWKEEHPPGFVEHRQAFDRRGVYGRWLREKPVVFERDGSLFVHAGISPVVAAISGSLDEINRRVRRELGVFDRAKEYLVRRGMAQPFFSLVELLAAAEEQLAVLDSPMGAFDETSPRDPRNAGILREFLALGGWFAMHPEGPLWFRGLAQWPDERASEVEDVLRKFGALRFVVGHGVQLDGGIKSRFGGRVFLIDTGMLSSYYTGGQASALEIRNGRFTAIYRGGRQALISGVADEAVPSGSSQ